MAETLIEWTDRVWNFVRGCQICSPGCLHCYAMLQAHRFDFPGGAYEGLTETGPNGPRWNGKIRIVEEKLAEPLKVKNPSKWFVNSMSDLFHEGVPFEVIDKAFAVMALTPWHTYQILTKRPDRMLQYFTGPTGINSPLAPYGEVNRHTAVWFETENFCHLIKGYLSRPIRWPLPNIWLGISCEDQKRADERIPLLLQTPAAVRWVSYEPALGPIDFHRLTGKSTEDRERNTVTFERFIDALSWIVIGGESGPSARPFNLSWARSVIQQRKDTNSAVFIKQIGAKPYACRESNKGKPDHRSCIDEGLEDVLSSKGGEMSEWPEDLRVREFPEVGR